MLICDIGYYKAQKRNARTSKRLVRLSLEKTLGRAQAKRVLKFFLCTGTTRKLTRKHR